MVLKKWQRYDLSLFPVGQRALSPNHLRIDECQCASPQSVCVCVCVWLCFLKGLEVFFLLMSTNIFKTWKLTSKKYCPIKKIVTKRESPQTKRHLVSLAYFCFVAGTSRKGRKKMEGFLLQVMNFTLNTICMLLGFSRFTFTTHLPVYLCRPGTQQCEVWGRWGRGIKLVRGSYWNKLLLTPFLLSFVPRCSG